MKLDGFECDVTGGLAFTPFRSYTCLLPISHLISTCSFVPFASTICISPSSLFSHMPLLPPTHVPVPPRISSPSSHSFSLPLPHASIRALFSSTYRPPISHLVSVCCSVPFVFLPRLYPSSPFLHLMYTELQSGERTCRKGVVLSND